MSTKLLNPFPSDIGRKHRAKSVPPEPHGLVANVDPSLVQQVFYIPPRKRKPNIQHHRQKNDLGAAVEVLERVAFCHGWMLQNRPTRLKSICSGSARTTV